MTPAAVQSTESQKGGQAWNCGGPPVAVAGSSGTINVSDPRTSSPKPIHVNARRAGAMAVVDVRGLEPLASALRTRRSPN